MKALSVNPDGLPEDRHNRSCCAREFDFSCVQGVSHYDYGRERRKSFR
jgi:hypothetical protein